jgi:ABC-type uncharacterized transport system substrate-binding protein
MRRVREPVAILIAAASLLAAPTADVAAHPHMWVTVETTVLYDKGTFTGLREKWTFDEYYTAYAIEGLDKNHDGIYDREELSELAKVNIEAMKEVGYFTFPVLGGQVVKLKPAQDYWLEHKDGVLSLYFTLPFEQPILTEAKGFAYAVEDPTYYIAFFPAKADPVKFGDGAPNSCKAQIGDRGGNDDAERLAKAFAQVAAPISAGQAVSIDCSGD